MHFTGKEHDTETGLENFGARYDASALGRFMSADPKNITAHLSDPQTFNRYVYTRNNPLLYVDPDGKDFQGALQAIKQVINEVTVKVGAGFGAGGKASGKGYEGQAEVAAKTTLTFSNGKASVSLTGEAGVTVKTPDTPKAGLGVEADKVLGSYDAKTGNFSGGEPITASTTVGTTTTNYNTTGPDQGSVSIGSNTGAEGGYGDVAGGSVTISPAGMSDIKKAESEITDMFTTPPPPLPPPSLTPPKPPQQCSNSCN